MCQTAHNAGSVAGIAVPNSQLARDVREFVRDTSTELLFNHSSRVYYFAALRGEKLGLRCDPDLLYTGAMFHDLGLLASHSSDADRFEVDGANAARAFLRARGISEEDANNVWLAIALHTTPGIPCHMPPPGCAGNRGRGNGCAGPDLQTVQCPRPRSGGGSLPA
jgi:HD superfamily phosphodiesterase